MHNYDITSIVKCLIVPEDRLRHTEISYLDYKYEDSPNNILNSKTGSFPTMDIKVFIKKLSGETMRTSLLTHTDELFEEVLNIYYDMSLENGKTSTYPKLEYDIKDDTRKLISKCMMTGNIIAQESRIGPANVVILPDNKYESLIKLGFQSGKIIVNPTKIHKDKIFVIRVDDTTSNPGLSLFASRSLVAERYIKLIKIMKKLGRNVDDLAFSYILTKIGLSPEKLVQVIYLTDKII